MNRKHDGIEAKARKLELLAPAGNPEKLEIAVHYGADAVYVGGENYSLRNFSGNFSLAELERAVSFARQKGVRIYVACNIFARNNEQKEIAVYLQHLAKMKPHALIVADPGIIFLARRLIPDIPLHLSTQANTTNYNSICFWANMGIQRVNIARELSLEEIREIVDRCSIEIEAFAHGAMCISYSGRCLLSNFLAKRDANRGMCSHPCRWKYAVVEELRPGHYMPIAEDQHGSYIFNSKDLCMIAHIPELIDAGIHAIKIEGRMKGIHYLAATVKTYRAAIDAYYDDPLNLRTRPEWREELNKINHRGYCTGFYFNDPLQSAANEREAGPPTPSLFLGKVLSESHSDRVNIEVRNKISAGDTIEVLRKDGPPVPDQIRRIIDNRGQSVPHAQPGAHVHLILNHCYDVNDLLRRSVGNGNPRIGKSIIHEVD